MYEEHVTDATVALPGELPDVRDFRRGRHHEGEEAEGYPEGPQPGTLDLLLDLLQGRQSPSVAVQLKVLPQRVVVQAHQLRLPSPRVPVSARPEMIVDVKRAPVVPDYLKVQESGK